ncbi:polysaccharide pyruvyl transferase family protein [Vreelandella lutescens]|uniref:Polysaccharide pyruvyl transferase domain-containing protein n=1 Tax=Vreelandella lutescens TaxID=1602943 RepID=A0ABQ1PMM2_9GAMM|nr:polysaccharide pyruvyl transferase family protein [Halomonas lutescens]GGC99772.1 hypothetical protein GCM10011382_32860 [Halomonas lutescens]
MTHVENITLIKKTEVFMKKIGVIGCLPELPLEFPVEKPENSGNMIHAQAPLRMFDNAVYNKDYKKWYSQQSGFKDFVNSDCSHLIITLANSLSIDKPDEEKYKRLRLSLEQYDVPVVVFGLGIQKKNFDISDAKLGVEAVKLLEFLSERSRYLGVRGEFTKKVIEQSSSINNVYVTGCPSFFSYPEEFSKIKKNLENKNGRPAVSLTNMANEDERKVLAYAYSQKHFNIEPVSRITHSFYNELLNGSNPDLPYYWKGIKAKKYFGDIEDDSVKKYYLAYYRLFRQVKPWLEFNKEHVSYTYGTRFHVNMASILSGVPALWLVHDARTKELTDFHGLPSANIEDFSKYIEKGNVADLIDYTAFYERLGYLFENFNNYLTSNGLPEINTP